MDKNLFYLNTIYETSRALSSLIQPGKILDTFLLTAMGSLGITQGFAALLNTQTQQATLFTKGVEPSDRKKLDDNIALICDCCLSDIQASTIGDSRFRIVQAETLGAHRTLFP